MRLNKTIMFVSIACVGLLAWGSVMTPAAGAAVILHDDFEGVAAGSPPDATIWNLELATPGATVIDDVSPGPAGGSQYFKVSRADGGKGTAAGGFNSQADGVVHFETMVYIDSTHADHALSIHLGAFDPAAPKNVLWTYCRIGLLNGGLTWYPPTLPTDLLTCQVDGTGQHYRDTGVDLVLDAWQKLEVDMTFDEVNGDSYVVTIDGTSSAPLTYFKTATGPIDGVGLKCGMSDQWVYYDDVTVTGKAPILWPGDADGDGFVNEVDAAALAANWLATEATWAMGDFSEDGTVDDADATIMATNWGHGPAAAAPEPSATVMLIAAGIMAVVGLALRCNR